MVINEKAEEIISECIEGFKWKPTVYGEFGSYLLAMKGEYFLFSFYHPTLDINKFIYNYRMGETQKNKYLYLSVSYDSIWTKCTPKIFTSTAECKLCIKKIFEKKFKLENEIDIVIVSGSGKNLI